jgi:hypothetical protein
VFVSARGDEAPAPAAATSAAPAAAEAFRLELDDAPEPDGPSPAALLDGLVAADPTPEGQRPGRCRGCPSPPRARINLMTENLAAISESDLP